MSGDLREGSYVTADGHQVSDHANFVKDAVHANLPRLFYAATELLFRKSQDYNSSQIAKGDWKLDDARVEYFPFKEKSYAHMLYTKVKRIMNLVESDKEPHFESLADSIVDLANYAAFFYSYLQDKDKIDA